MGDDQAFRIVLAIGMLAILLVDRFGDAYRDYMQRTGRF